MSFYPNSDMNELLDGKPEAPAAKSGSDRQPAPRSFFANSDHVSVDDVQTRGGAAAAAIAQPPQPPDEQLPDKLKEIRGADERVLYDSQKTYASVFQRGKLGDSMQGEDPQLVEQVDKFAAGVYSDMRLSVPEAAEVHSVFNTQVDDEIAADWRAESEAYLRSLGPEWPAKLALAKELARRDPRVFKLLEGAYGDHPTLVKLLIEKAQAEKRDGRL